MRKFACIVLLMIGSSIVTTSNVAAHSMPASVGGGGMVPRESLGRRISTSVHETPSSPAHLEGRWRGKCEGWRLGENLTPAIWAHNPSRGALMIQRLIACVFAVWAPGQSTVALYVANRESGYYPWAANPSGCQGVFQHQVAYWSSRAHEYLFKGWFAPWMKWPTPADPGRLIYDPRANVIAAAKMVGPGGNWGPWKSTV